MQNIGVLSTFAATLFALLNPLGMLPVFIGYSAGLSIGVQRWLALFVSLTVLALMLVFLFTGHAILGFFGISLDSFRLAGGIVLLLIGIQIVNGDVSQAARDQVVEATTSTLSEAKSIYRRIVVPFAMPLLVGPGVIANLILYASEARAAQNDALLLGLVAVTIAISVLTLVLLLSGRFLRDLMGDVGLSIVTRILGLLVASIGMQFIVTGLSNVIVQTIAPAVLKLQS